jgi:hypothetical protein
MKPGNQTNDGPGANSGRAICKIREWLVSIYLAFLPLTLRGFLFPPEVRYTERPTPLFQGAFLLPKTPKPKRDKLKGEQQQA